MVDGVLVDILAAAAIGTSFSAAKVLLPRHLPTHMVTCIALLTAAQRLLLVGMVAEVMVAVGHHMAVGAATAVVGVAMGPARTTV